MKSGRLRALAVTSDKRSVVAPDAADDRRGTASPTASSNSWYGVFAPAKTPAPIVAEAQRGDGQGAADARRAREAARAGRRGRAVDRRPSSTAIVKDELRKWEMRDPRSEDHGPNDDGRSRAARTGDASVVSDEVAALIARARAAQAAIDDYDQARVDELVTAAGWAIVEPSRNRALAELAVRDTGLGNVDDKIAKNRRKTMGLLRDLAGARSAGIIAEDPRARHRRDRAAGRRRRRDHAVDQSGRDAGEQHHQRAEGPQRDRARAVAEGRVDARAAARVRPRRARPRRRAARSRAVAARAGVARAHARADAAGRLGRRDRLAEQRARRLLERNAGARRRRRQRRGRSSTRRRTSPTRRARSRVEDLRQRDQLLVGEQRDRRRRRSRRACSTRSRRRAACCSTPREARARARRCSRTASCEPRSSRSRRARSRGAPASTARAARALPDRRRGRRRRRHSRSPARSSRRCSRSTARATSTPPSQRAARCSSPGRRSLGRAAQRATRHARRGSG